uniref:Senescence-associated protein n=1 Tax=Solanum lycopersicum TaxID=4081 RepID=A0A8F5AJH5_SOLLC|nr:senescence-associated protein [Solanum lycopersicum]
MIGRADIEGSKSNVAMNASLPQASYSCDVPPQPNSAPDSVFRLDGPAKRALGPKRGAMPHFRSKFECQAPMQHTY